MNELREWLAALTTPMIAVLGIWIAFQQLRLSRYQFCNDLTEKRLLIFYAMRNLLGAGLKGPYPDIKEVDEFELAIVEAPFLFGPEIISYLEEMGDKYMAIWLISDQQKDKDFEDRRDEQQKLEKRREYKKWMREQIVQSKKLFKPYLDLSKAGVGAWSSIMLWKDRKPK